MECCTRKIPNRYIYFNFMINNEKKIENIIMEWKMMEDC